MPSIELGHLTKVNIAVLFSPSWGSLIAFFVSEISLFVIFVISSGFPNICNKSYYVLVWSYPIVLYPTAVWEWFWQVWAQLHKLGEWGNTPSGVGRRGKGGLTLSVGSPVVCQSTSPEPACINFFTLSRSYTFVGCKLLSADQSRPIFVKSQLFGKVVCTEPEDNFSEEPIKLPPLRWKVYFYQTPVLWFVISQPNADISKSKSKFRLFKVFRRARCFPC